MGFMQLRHAYDIQLVRSRIRIGGNSAAEGGKFVPNINVSKWTDEFWMNINFPEEIRGEIESFDGEKIILECKDYDLRYYPDKDKNLEWEIVFRKKPDISHLVANILHSEGLRFLYQPPLTQQEIETGAKRPDNVVGSYAVYTNKKNRKYRAGKFCHIYYPYLIDADGKSVRADSFSIENGQMIIGLPKNWLDVAIYPVTLDPTLGNDHVGASTNSIGAYRVQTTNEEATDSSGGTTTTYHIAIPQEWSATTLKMGIYAISGGVPSGNVVDQASGAASISDDCNFASGGGSLSASTTYTIGVIADTDYLCDYKYDAGSSGDSSLKTGTTYASEFTSPAGSYGSSPEIVSMWVDYAPAVSIEQEGYRWRYDNGDEDEATWAENQDTGITAPKNVNKRLRFAMNMTGNATSKQFQLEYKKSTESTYKKIT